MKWGFKHFIIMKWGFKYFRKEILNYFYLMVSLAQVIKYNVNITSITEAFKFVPKIKIILFTYGALIY